MAEVDPAAAIVTEGKTDDNHGAKAEGNQQGASDWAKDFDEGLRKRVEKFKTPADLAKSYVELETYSSKSFQDMTPEQKEKYIKRLGLPESPDGYELSTVSLPQGIERSPRADAEFKKLVHDMKLTKEQAKGIHEYSMRKFSESVIAAREAEKRQSEEKENALRTAWGAALEANNQSVEKLIRLGGDEFVQAMNSGPGKEPSIRKGLFEISKLLANETLVSGRVEQPKSQARPGFVVDFSKSPELAPRTS